jgi:hypothetical protein
MLRRFAAAECLELRSGLVVLPTRISRRSPAMKNCNMVAVLSAALLIGSVSFANAECGRAIKGGTVVAEIGGSASALSAQAKKSTKNKNGTEKSSQSNCSPEHKKAGHC